MDEAPTPLNYATPVRKNRTGESDFHSFGIMALYLVGGGTLSFITSGVMLVREKAVEFAVPLALVGLAFLVIGAALGAFGLIFREARKLSAIALRIVAYNLIVAGFLVWLFGR